MCLKSNMRVNKRNQPNGTSGTPLGLEKHIKKIIIIFSLQIAFKNALRVQGYFRKNLTSMLS